MRSLLVLALVLLGTSCGKAREANDPQDRADAVTKASVNEREMWERSRQCSDHAERLATRFERDLAQYPKAAQLAQWSNHYNHTDRRCYVQLDFFNRSVTKENRVMPVFHHQLYDAIEHLELASYTEEQLQDRKSVV